MQVSAVRIAYRESIGGAASLCHTLDRTLPGSNKHLHGVVSGTVRHVEHYPAEPVLQIPDSVREAPAVFRASCP